MRIIAGRHKGLKLKEFELGNIRPTSDKVRESVFNKLQFNIRDANVLDLFGGTGAISLEFVSRGAKVTTCDNNIDSIKLIKENFAKAKEVPQIIEGDYKTILKRLQGKSFDIIFLDPPFATDYGLKALELIIKFELLQDDGMVVFEHPSGKTFDTPNGLQIVDCKKYGSISVSYLVRDYVKSN